ncbi:hypothetical protein bcgnr5390_61660 [Bacillus luti]|nr:hypothetical protein BC2903_31170 [Bacillus cereus]
MKTFRNNFVELESPKDRLRKGMHSPAFSKVRKLVIEKGLIEVIGVEVQRIYTTQPVYYMNYKINGLERKLVLPIYLECSFTDKLIEIAMELLVGKTYSFTTSYMFEHFHVAIENNSIKLSLINRFGVDYNLELDNNEFLKLAKMLELLRLNDSKVCNRIGIITASSELNVEIPFKIKTFDKNCSVVIKDIEMQRSEELAI